MSHEYISCSGHGVCNLEVSDNLSAADSLVLQSLECECEGVYGGVGCGSSASYAAWMCSDVCCEQSCVRGAALDKASAKTAPVRATPSTGATGVNTVSILRHSGCAAFLSLLVPVRYNTWEMWLSVLAVITAVTLGSGALYRTNEVEQVRSSVLLWHGPLSHMKTGTHRDALVLA